MAKSQCDTPIVFHFPPPVVRGGQHRKKRGKVFSKNEMPVPFLQQRKFHLIMWPPDTLDILCHRMDCWLSILASLAVDWFSRQIRELCTSNLCQEIGPWWQILPRLVSCLVTACLGAERPFFSTYVEGSDVESGAIRRWAPAESVALRLRCVGLFSVGALHACVGVCVCVFFSVRRKLSCAWREKRESVEL